MSCSAAELGEFVVPNSVVGHGLNTASIGANRCNPWLLSGFKILVASLSLATVRTLHADPASFDLPAQPANTALLRFAEQARVEVLFSYSDLGQVQANAVVGAFEPEAALALLLSDTGFSPSINAAGKYVIRREAKPAETAALSKGNASPDSDSEAYEGPPNRLKTVYVWAPYHKPPMTEREHDLLKVFLELGPIIFGWRLGSERGYAFTPGRVPQRIENIAFATAILESDTLKCGASATLDGTLRANPDFRLAQRVRGDAGPLIDHRATIRNLNTAVLLDGAPLNDPFGGWVPWNAVPRDSLARVEIVAGGGATAWGNGAVGGVVQLLTHRAIGRMVTEIVPAQEPGDPAEKRHVIHGSTQLVAAVGERRSGTAEVAITRPSDHGVLQLAGRISSTDGFFRVASQDRGAIDIPAWSRDRWLQARWRQPLRKNLELTAAARAYRSGHGHGTPYQQDSAHGELVSLEFAGAPTTKFSWNGVAYVHTSSSESTFSLVDSTRTGETPWIDQLAVPATAFGASWEGAWWATDNNSRTNAGVDFRHVRGTSRQHLVFSHGEFTQERVAGGEQSNLGLFLFRHHYISPSWRASVGVRLDAWREGGGHRREIDRQSQAILRDDEFASDNDLELLPSVGVVWLAGRGWRIHANAQSAHRRPTLAEQYQTFGRNGTVTEANPALHAERNTSAEIGVTYAPSKSVVWMSVSAFANRLSDLIADVRHSPATTSLDHVTRTRINVDEARLQGARIGFGLRLSKSLSIDGSVSWSTSTIERADIAPLLAGNQLARTPRHTVIVSAKWQPKEFIALNLHLRTPGREFSDTENTLRLSDALIADFGASYALSSKTEFFLTAENFTNALVDTDRGAAGVLYTGSPRTVAGGVRLNW